MRKKRGLPLLAYDFDLGRFTGSEYASELDLVFNSEDWVSLVGKRHKLVTSLFRGGKKEMVYPLVEKIDRKLSEMLYYNLFMRCITRADKAAGETVYDFFSQFAGTEKECRAVAFWEISKRVYFVVDVLMGYVTDIKGILNELDEEQRVINYHGLEATLGNLQQIVFSLNGKKADEDRELFFEYSDRIEEYIESQVKEFDSKIEENYNNRRK